MNKPLQIGLTLQVIRKAKKLQQKDFAKQIGISGKHLSEIENGHKEPTWAMLCKILKGLDSTILIKTELPYTKAESGIEDVSIEVK